MASVFQQPGKEIYLMGLNTLQLRYLMENAPDFKVKLVCEKLNECKLKSGSVDNRFDYLIDLLNREFDLD